MVCACDGGAGQQLGLPCERKGVPRDVPACDRLLRQCDDRRDPVPDRDEPPHAGDVEVLAANQRFYDAFEASDMDAMSDVWAHDPAVACTHPGWQTLHGWAAVSSSWFALFQQPSPLQFILTDARARVEGPLAWVTVDENLIGPGPAQTVAALNLFRRTDHGWKLVCHHGSPVVPRPGPGPGPD